MAGHGVLRYHLVVILFLFFALHQMECEKKGRRKPKGRKPTVKHCSCVSELNSLEQELSNAIDYETDHLKSTIDMRFGGLIVKLDGIADDTAALIPNVQSVGSLVQAVGRNISAHSRDINATAERIGHLVQEVKGHVANNARALNNTVDRHADRESDDSSPVIREDCLASSTGNREVTSQLRGIQATNEMMQSDLLEIRATNEKLQSDLLAVQANLSLKLDAVLHLLGLIQVSANTGGIQSTLARPKDCYDVTTMGYTVSGLYPVYVRNITTDVPVEIFCDMQTEGGGWSVFQRREDGSVDFHRNWVEYKSGFGDKTAEFWLGNEIIHLITRQRHYSVRFDLWDNSNQHAYAQYERFSVADESHLFRLSFTAGSYTGTAGDSMDLSGGDNLNGQAFSTTDFDNDKSGGNCAGGSGKGGWWYNTCSRVTLNGQYNGNMWRGIIWYFWKYWESLKKTEIKVRPMNV